MIASRTMRSSQTTTVREHLLAALRRAADFNDQDVVPPVALLWPDEARVWHTVVADLRRRTPVVSLGDLDEEGGQGPVEWLRIRVEAATHPESGDLPLVVYLPGVPMRQLTDATELPDALRPLAGLAFRSGIFAHRNGSDWTPAGFFANKERGLGLDVARDAETRLALVAALPLLLDESVAGLTGQRLDAVKLNKLTVGDDVREILLWLDRGDEVQAAKQANGTWPAFVSLVRKQYDVDPERDGRLPAAERLGERLGRWSEVWDRFREAPGNYPAIPDLLSKAQPQGQMMLGTGELTWPRENDEAEAEAGIGLDAIRESPLPELRERLQALVTEHSPRLESVWADLGQTPMAEALVRLAELAGLTRIQPAGEDVAALTAAYAEDHYLADAAFLACLAILPPGHERLATISVIAERLYRPWLEATVSSFHSAWLASPPADLGRAGVDADEPAGTCVLFVDGLRLDLGKELARTLEERDHRIEFSWALAPVPTVTGTCKPALTPLADDLGPGPGLDPDIRGGGPHFNQMVLKRKLDTIGWEVFGPGETGGSKQRGWTEGGDIDKLGHSLGVKLVRQLPGEINSLADRVSELLASGWRRVVVVTDHGWLLLPGQLPKAALPEHLTEPRKGRCARLKAEASVPTGTTVLPWHWDPEVRIALAPGVHAYEAGKVYEHGGLSPQESIVPRLVVTAREERRTAVASGPIIDLQWLGMALRVKAAGVPEGARADLRWHAGDPGSSLLSAPKSLSERGARLLVDDEDSGESAVLVLIDAQGNALAQRPVQIPEG